MMRKQLLCLLAAGVLLSVNGVTRAQGLPAPAEEVGPAVDTSASAAPAVVPPAVVPTPNAKPPARAAGAVRRAGDRVDLDTSQITGNRELPKVLYIVPWKRPDLGDLAGKPVNSLLDEVLAPIDRDVFRRENRYFESLQHSSGPGSPAADKSAPKPPADAGSTGATPPAQTPRPES